MPTVATFDGIRIQFYWDEHPPPHFHAEFAEYRASIEIETLQIVEGYLPRTQLRKVQSWARPRVDALLTAWTECRSDKNPRHVE